MMMSTVDYRSSEEVIFVLKEAMKNLEEEGEEEDHIIQIESDDDAVQGLAMDEESQVFEASQVFVESQVVEAPREESVGGGGDNSEQPQPSPPAIPAKIWPPPSSHVQFFKKVLMIKGKLRQSILSLSFFTSSRQLQKPPHRFWNNIKA